MSPPSAPADRETTSPCHLQVFYRDGAFPLLHSLPPASTPDEPSISVFTYPSATLYELSLLLTPLIPPHLLSNSTSHHSKPSLDSSPSAVVGTRLAYRLAYPATSSNNHNAPKYISKDLGVLTIGSDPPLLNDSLEDCGFEVGDYLMLAILRGNETVPPVVGQRTGPPPRPQYSGFRRNGNGVRMPEGQWARGGGRGVRGGGGYGDIHRPRSWGRGRFGEGALPRGEWRRGEDLPPSGDSGPGFGYQDGYRSREGAGLDGSGWERRGGGRGRDRW